MTTKTEEERRAYIKKVVDAAPPIQPGSPIWNQLRALLTYGDSGSTGGPPVPWEPGPPPPPRRTAVYKYYDQDEILLYVGKSVQPESRDRGHQRHADWYKFVVRRTEDWYETEDLALENERLAIQCLDPLFNGKYASPAARAGRVTYLKEKTNDLAGTP